MSDSWAKAWAVTVHCRANSTAAIRPVRSSAATADTEVVAALLLSADPAAAEVQPPTAISRKAASRPRPALRTSGDDKGHRPGRGDRHRGRVADGQGHEVPPRCEAGRGEPDAGVVRAAADQRAAAVEGAGRAVAGVGDLESGRQRAGPHREAGEVGLAAGEGDLREAVAACRDGELGGVLG